MILFFLLCMYGPGETPRIGIDYVTVRWCPTGGQSCWWPPWEPWSIMPEECEIDFDLDDDGDVDLRDYSLAISEMGKTGE